MHAPERSYTTSVDSTIPPTPPTRCLNPGLWTHPGIDDCHLFRGWKFLLAQGCAFRAAFQVTSAATWAAHSSA